MFDHLLKEGTAMTEKNKAGVKKHDQQRTTKAKEKTQKLGKFPIEITTAKKKEQTLTMRPESKGKSKKK